MEKRKENVYKGTFVRALVKTLISWLIFLALVVVFIGVICVKVFGTWDVIRPDAKQAVVLMMLFGSIIIYIPPMLQANIRHEKEKINKKLVENVLFSSSYIKVMPKKNHLKYKNFFEREIPKIGEYFAILSKDNKEVRIFIKLNKYNDYLFLESIYKEEFVDFYEIAENRKNYISV